MRGIGVPTACLFALLMAGCQDSPVFWRSFGSPETCGKDGKEVPLSLEFSENGQSVILLSEPAKPRLEFASSQSWFDENYVGSGYKLTLDPEVYLKRPDGNDLTPCVW